jgi:CRP/FNR family cyclic AMP-dependent transcriptional regulator
LGFWQVPCCSTSFLKVLPRCGPHKEAVVAIFWLQRFFGEGGMAGQRIRMATATAIVPTTVLVIGKDEMMRVLHAESSLSDRFIKFMLARNIRVEANLID